MCDSLPQRSLHYSDSEVLYTCVANNGSALHRSSLSSEHVTQDFLVSCQ